MSKKIETFSQIRNKFAHLRTIETWKGFYSISKNYSKIERDLKKWYEQNEIPNDNYEIYCRYLYTYLTEDIFKFLVRINSYYEHNKREEKYSLYKEQQNQKLLEFMRMKIKNELEINDIDEEFRKYEDEQFMKSYFEEE